MGQDDAVPDESPESETDRWTTLAGPAVLGRSVLISPGTRVPAPWVNAQRIHLSDQSLGSPQTLQSVRRAFLTRTPTVYEVASGLKAPARGTDDRGVLEVASNLDFVAEATLRLVRPTPLMLAISPTPSGR
jgi:hypothetical protein